MDGDDRLPTVGYANDCWWVRADSIEILEHSESIAFSINQNIANAQVILQKNGEQSASTSTNADGRATVNSSSANGAENLLIIKKSGYSTLVAKCPCDGMTYALSPVLKDLNSMRIVLNWGQSPLDLDSHLSYKNQHVYWDNKQGQDANLDVDDTDSYGPETVTIDKRLDGQYYVY